MPKLVTSRKVGDKIYRLVGGQSDGTQISLQIRKSDEPQHQFSKFRERMRDLKIISIDGRFYLLYGKKNVSPSKPHTWPEGFLEEHFTKMKARPNNWRKK